MEVKQKIFHKKILSVKYHINNFKYEEEQTEKRNGLLFHKCTRICLIFIKSRLHSRYPEVALSLMKLFVLFHVPTNFLICLINFS